MKMEVTTAGSCAFNLSNRTQSLRDPSLRAPLETRVPSGIPSFSIGWKPTRGIDHGLNRQVISLSSSFTHAERSPPAESGRLFPAAPERRSVGHPCGSPSPRLAVAAPGRLAVASPSSSSPPHHLPVIVVSSPPSPLHPYAGSISITAP